MSSTPRGERLNITLLGNRNSGKSSLINALTGQEIAIVSDIPGTTTDPVDKRYELIPIGPVTFFDTAGLDDVGELGAKRIKTTLKVLYKTDIAIFVNDGTPFTQSEYDTIKRLQDMKIPFVVFFNKADLRQADIANVAYCTEHKISSLIVSAFSHLNIDEAKQLLIEFAPQHLKENRVLVGDLISMHDTVILVTPIDLSAPKGRLILPQVQALRDLLDYHAVVLVVQESELSAALASLKDAPKLVVTDSQVVLEVWKTLPEDVNLTTFSILFARYKGELDILVEGIRQIDELADGDKILIAEACSHHVESDDIGRFKIPNWLKKYTGKDLSFEVYAGHDFPENLEDYALIIHCGACMLNQMETSRRILEAQRRGVPITNYGLTISKSQGVFERAIAPLLDRKDTR
ncbi:MAG: [FeFe] hydrogenase H-cluster maturation GTPase HydF [Candidatus Cloacimonetes bacterium]|nr:[FeFe] hydrogenase H-cluster maturation GTPase HydF [Candidatus Cloacimonadota bacterium]